MHPQPFYWATLSHSRYQSSPTLWLSHSSEPTAKRAWTSLQAAFFFHDKQQNTRRQICKNGIRELAKSVIPMLVWSLSFRLPSPVPPQHSVMRMRSVKKFSTTHAHSSAQRRSTTLQALRHLCGHSQMDSRVKALV